MVKIKVLVLAAGYATRLYPLTLNKPKSLLPVAGKPMIEYIVEKISPIKEVDEIFIVTNNKFYGNFEKWRKNYECEKPIEIINDKTTSDEDKKGAIGDMKFVKDLKKIDDDLMVVGGDNLFEFEMRDLVDFFYDKNDPIVVLHDVKHDHVAMRMGVVEIDENEKLISFVEKPPKPKTTLIAICMYLFPKKDLFYIDKYLKEGRNPDQPGRLIEWLHNVRHTFGFVFEGSWFDIGDKEKLEEADELYRKKK